MSQYDDYEILSSLQNIIRVIHTHCESDRDNLITLQCRIECFQTTQDHHDDFVVKEEIQICGSNSATRKRKRGSKSNISYTCKLDCRLLITANTPDAAGDSVDIRASQIMAFIEALGLPHFELINNDKLRGDMNPDSSTDKYHRFQYRLELGWETKPCLWFQRVMEFCTISHCFHSWVSHIGNNFSPFY